MKFVVKQMVISAVALMIAVPAIAAEQAGAPHAPTKGTKSYQAARDTAPEQTADATAEDVQNIAPAAGASDEKADQGKSFKEELRLPRKN